jgi:hypothetical protein
MQLWLCYQHLVCGQIFILYMKHRKLWNQKKLYQDLEIETFKGIFCTNNINNYMRSHVFHDMKSVILIILNCDLFGNIINKKLKIFILCNFSFINNRSLTILPTMRWHKIIKIFLLSRTMQKIYKGIKMKHVGNDHNAKEC